MARNGMISRFVWLLYPASLSPLVQFTGRYAHVAYEQGSGSGEVPRRLGAAIARSQSCSDTNDVFGERQDHLLR